MHRKVIEVPEGIEVTIEGLKVRVKGKLGELERNFENAHTRKTIRIEKEGNKIIVSTDRKNRKYKAIAFAIAAHIRNMFKGVQEGFEYRLKVIYTHFPINVQIQGGEMVIQNFMGEKAVRKVKLDPNVEVKIQGSEIIVKGLDKEMVGQLAAKIEQSCRVKGRDRRRFQDGIYMTMKAGKWL